MTNILRLAAAATALLLAACSEAPAEPPALVAGEWSVDSDASQLSYVSVKAGEIAEVNRFEELSGSVSPDGTAQITIDLASVNTGIDIRNERMRDVFFEVADHPTATVTTKVDPAAFEALAIGASITQPLEATLSVKGVEMPITSEVQVIRVADDRVLAVSTAPVVINAADLQLVDGLAQLQELAGLPSISPVVPVTFSLSITR